VRGPFGLQDKRAGRGVPPGNAILRNGGFSCWSCAPVADREIGVPGGEAKNKAKADPSLWTASGPVKRTGLHKTEMTGGRVKSSKRLADARTAPRRDIAVSSHRTPKGQGQQQEQRAGETPALQQPREILRSAQDDGRGERGGRVELRKYNRSAKCAPRQNKAASPRLRSGQASRPSAALGASRTPEKRGRGWKPPLLFHEDGFGDEAVDAFADVDHLRDAAIADQRDERIGFVAGHRDDRLRREELN